MIGTRLLRRLFRGGPSPSEMDLALTLERLAGRRSPITNPCHCNQPDLNRHSFHQRGDDRFCRDTFEAGE